MDATVDEPTQELRGRDALAQIFNDLNPLQQPPPTSTARARWVLDSDRATGESGFLAVVLVVGEDGERTMMVAAPAVPRRVRQAGRRLVVRRGAVYKDDWAETRPSVV